MLNPSDFLPVATLIFCLGCQSSNSTDIADLGSDLWSDGTKMKIDARSADSSQDKSQDTKQDVQKITDANSDVEVQKDSGEPDLTTAGFTDSFDGDGVLIDYVTNNASALPKTERVNGRYRAELTDNQNDVTLHFNGDQGRLDAKLVSFPFEFIARNIGIGTLADSQVAPPPTGGPYLFAGVQVHVEDFNSINSSHVVVGHRGGTGFTIEGKNTLNGNSSVNDIGANTAPDGRADIRIVGSADNTLTVYWQIPNLSYETVADNWSTYGASGRLPGTAPTYRAQVYIGLITYAFGNRGVPFVGTCDAIQIK